VSRSLHYAFLIVALGLGLLLRFWHLDLKPLWLDETVTWVFSTGHRYEDIPTGKLLPLQSLWSELTWQTQTCHNIAQSINEQSTHPPLFFCWMHYWLGLWQTSGQSIPWQLRSLPALAGTAAIAAVYGLARVAYSRQIGLMAAGLMAVSPFAMYLSQEARHYTLPMLLITLSLIPMVQLCQGIQAKKGSFWQWSAWVGLNGLGFYVHYFCLLAFVAQCLTLLWLVWRQKPPAWRSFVLAISAVCLMILPWVPNLLGHGDRPETEWLKFEAKGILDWIGPVARLLGGGIVSVVMLPVEEQSLPIKIVSGAGLLLITGWLSRLLWRGSSKLIQDATTRLATTVLGSFLLWVLAEYLALVYFLYKDITLAFRYNFVFYPALCVLLAAAISKIQLQRSPILRSPIILVLLIGMISSGFVVNDYAFLKPFQPDAIATRLTKNINTPLIVLKEYKSGQDIALGLSFAHAIDRLHSKQPIYWGFKKSSESQIDLRSVVLRPQRNVSLWQISALQEKSGELGGLSDRATNRELNCNASNRGFSEFGLNYLRYNCLFNVKVNDEKGQQSGDRH
jgi:uncharacterized membrane protein